MWSSPKVLETSRDNFISSHCKQVISELFVFLTSFWIKFYWMTTGSISHFYSSNAIKLAHNLYWIHRQRVERHRHFESPSFFMAYRCDDFLTAKVWFILVTSPIPLQVCSSNQHGEYLLLAILQAIYVD